MSRARVAGAILLACAPLSAWAIGDLEVLQTGRHFALEELHIRLGSVISFVNADDFDHQVYIEAADFNFESDEQSPGQAIKVTFSRAGVFAVRCHIHPKMHLRVTVSDAS